MTFLLNIPMSKKVFLILLAISAAAWLVGRFLLGYDVVAQVYVVVVPWAAWLFWWMFLRENRRK